MDTAPKRLRPDLEAAIARLPPKLQKKAFNAPPSHLLPDETVERVCAALSADPGSLGNSGILTVTDRRLLFTAQSWMSGRIDRSYLRSNISSVEWNEDQIKGHIRLEIAGSHVIFYLYPVEDGRELTAAIQHCLEGPAPREAKSDPVILLNKLAHLRDSGIITLNEFERKKSEILRRI